jgi:hypothetical protein
MSIDRTSWLCLLAFTLLALSPASGQDFNDRFAAWQGRSPLSGRMPAATEIVTEQAAPAQVLPTTTRGAGPRSLGEVYNTPIHSPNYNAPWTNSTCATCSHNPGFVAASDALGTCDYAGGHPLFAASDACGACGPDGCGHGSCCACGGAGGGCDWGPYCSNSLVWAKFDLLLWWRQGRDFPALVTTDPTTEASTTAGVLPDAQILFGGQRVGTDLQAGGRADIGFFFDPRQCSGIGVRVFGLGRDASSFTVASNDVPVLAVPFVDFDTGNNDALLVAFPGLRSGSVNVSGSSSVFSNDVYWRCLLCRDCYTRLDFITGWNYSRVADEVNINTRTEVLSDPTIATGTVLTTRDQFTAHNDFNGGILGLLWERNCGCWQTSVLARMSLGNMHQTMIIAGSGEARLDGDVEPTTGFFARERNTGRSSRNEFTAITEFGANLAYRFAPCTQFTVGYSFLYWNDILTAAKGIDTQIGTNQDGTTRPQFDFRHSDFWVQGINLGLTREF